MNIQISRSILKTLDGSHTIYVPAIDEHYHSVNGAVQESRHIFIDASLKICEKDEIRILEVGFGTGLNAFLAFLEAEQSGKNVIYTAIELFPLVESEIERLNYSEHIEKAKKEQFRAIHAANWGVEVKISTHFAIKKILADFTVFDLQEKYDVVFFDAFSPEKQPEMWTENIFLRLYEHCNVGAILTTYCAKGEVRRTMQAAGFAVERLPGPLGKREMLRGIKISDFKFQISNLESENLESEI